jgi:hypothetical protein
MTPNWPAKVRLVQVIRIDACRFGTGEHTKLGDGDGSSANGAQAAAAEANVALPRAHELCLTDVGVLLPA